MVATHANSTDSEVAQLAERCLLRSTDPASMGFSQQMMGHYLVDLRADSNDDEALYQLATAIHSAANNLRPPRSEV